MRIIGLRVFHYAKETQIDIGVFENQNYTKHIICAVLDDYDDDDNDDDDEEYKTKVEIELSQKRDMCPSGYTQASWGLIEIRVVDDFHGLTHFPKEKIVIDDISPDGKDKYNEIKNQVFSFSRLGKDSDGYYPDGDYKVNMELFETSPRYKENRQVYILTGPSGIGKSFLAHQLKDLSVYETDSKYTLPKIMLEDVIVLGNKYNFNIDAIKNKLFDNPDVHIVNFS